MNDIDVEELLRRYPPPRQQRGKRTLSLIPASEIIEEVEAFLKRTAMTKTDFGLASVGSVNIVQHLRKGRSITDVRYAKLKHFMASR